MMRKTHHMGSHTLSGRDGVSFLSSPAMDFLHSGCQSYSCIGKIRKSLIGGVTDIPGIDVGVFLHERVALEVDWLL